MHFFALSSLKNPKSDMHLFFCIMETLGGGGSMMKVALPDDLSHGILIVGYNFEGDGDIG